VRGWDDADCSELAGKTVALVRRATLAAIEAAPASYQWGVGAALAAGATEEEIVATLVAVAPIIGRRA
jgi:alkylhydroperoxidase/carboxymuconolactone decarboxylase family protein YurZ